MKKIAILGPEGTFSEIAGRKYIDSIEDEMEIVFYPTITKVFNAIGSECDKGIIPMENTLDGYVQLSLDLLSKTDLKIIKEFVLPIQFSFLGNIKTIEQLERVYVQFKTQGQCVNFLEGLNNPKVIITESNGESFQKVKIGLDGEGAIIPSYILERVKDIPFIINNVTDSKENETRFIVLSKESENYEENKNYKTSLVIMDAVYNKPGALSKILNEFAANNINLTSIVSRPTKRELGKYYFFIDIIGHSTHDSNVKKAVDIINEQNLIKILGSYTSI